MTTYILNLETGKLELSFSKPEYQSMPEEEKRALKSAFLWAGSIGCWVSRSIHNHYWALEFCKKYGFEDKGTTGEKLSFAEKVEREAEKADERFHRMEAASDRAADRAVSLQSEFNRLRGDIAFITQPASPNSRFGRCRDRIMARYDRGFEELAKAQYYQERAARASATADQSKFKNPTYLDNRIRERQAEIRDIERRMKEADAANNDDWFARLSDRLEEVLDELTFFQGKLSDIGGIAFSKANVHKGDWVLIRGRWDLVLRANPTTVTAKSQLTGFELKYPYAEIRQVKSTQMEPA